MKSRTTVSDHLAWLCSRASFCLFLRIAVTPYPYIWVELLLAGFSGRDLRISILEKRQRQWTSRSLCCKAGLSSFPEWHCVKCQHEDTLRREHHFHKATGAASLKWWHADPSFPHGSREVWRMKLLKNRVRMMRPKKILRQSHVSWMMNDLKTGGTNGKSSTQPLSIKPKPKRRIPPLQRKISRI